MRVEIEKNYIIVYTSYHQHFSISFLLSTHVVSLSKLFGEKNTKQLLFFGWNLIKAIKYGSCQHFLYFTKFFNFFFLIVWHHLYYYNYNNINNYTYSVFIVVEEFQTLLEKPCTMTVKMTKTKTKKISFRKFNKPRHDFFLPLLW